MIDGRSMILNKHRSGNIAGFRFTITTVGASDTFTLPIYNGGTYDFLVHWGDGSTDNITAFDDAAVTHTYAAADTYEIKITGTITGWRFNNAGDKTLINDIKNWGPLRLGNLDGYFYGCTNLTISATDIPDLTGTINLSAAFRLCSSLTTVPSMNSWNTAAVTNMGYMFYVASAFNQNIGSWNTAAVTSMIHMFESATVFDQNLAAWVITSVTDMTSMFLTVTLSTSNYSNILIGWEAQVEQPNVVFSGGNSKYSAGAAATARAALVTNGWTITDGGQA